MPEALQKYGTVHLVIEPAYVREGIPGNTSACPIVIAAKHTIPNVRDIQVDWDELTFQDSHGLWYSASLPQDASVFVGWFDQFATGQNAWAAMTSLTDRPKPLEFDIQPRPMFPD